MAGKHELEKFEYLFVDIEWNQTPGTNGIEDREPIQICVVATDESMNLKKSFSRAMRLSSEEKNKGKRKQITKGIRNQRLIFL